MREFTNEQIVFFCNACGELHRGGKEMLDAVEDLPLPLQSVYESYWTDSLTLPCYIAYVDDRPGLLLCAEYNEEECNLQNIPHDYAAKYAALSERCRQLERLVKTVNDTAEVGIGVDTGVDLEVVLFIPTQFASEHEILRLYYLMDSFVFSNPPESVDWEQCSTRLLELMKCCRLSSYVDAKLASQLMPGIEPAN